MLLLLVMLLQTVVMHHMQVENAYVLNVILLMYFPLIHLLVWLVAPLDLVEIKQCLVILSLIVVLATIVMLPVLNANYLIF